MNNNDESMMSDLNPTYLEDEQGHKQAKRSKLDQKLQTSSITKRNICGNWFAKYKCEIVYDKLTALGTDGLSVVTGKASRVVTRFKNNIRLCPDEKRFSWWKRFHSDRYRSHDVFVQYNQSSLTVAPHSDLSMKYNIALSCGIALKWMHLCKESLC